MCWAHLLRDFARIANRAGQAGVIGQRLQACGYALFRWREQNKPPKHFEWLQRCLHKHLRDGTCTRTANTYTNLLKIESALWQFLKNPAVPPTNNAAERALRGFALGRKSWLFAGSDRGAERAAFMATLIMSAKLNDIDPQAWLADVLANIADTPISRLEQLLPWNWKPAVNA